MKYRLLNVAAISLALGATLFMSACASQWRCQPKERPAPPPAALTPPPGETPAPPQAEAVPPPAAPEPPPPPPAPLCSVKEIAVSHKLNQFGLTPGSQKEMKMLASCLVENSAQKLRIDGHADQRGSDKRNQWLSEQRANTVKDYMVSQGVSGENIEVNAWGATKPVAPGRDRASLKLNRQTIVTVVAP